MDVRRLLAVLVTALLVSCGASSGSPGVAGDSPDPQRARLLAAADAAAERDGGKAKRVEAVETTRGAAADLTGHSNQDQGERVWVVQVSGDHYTCDSCSRPSGASAPSGTYLTLVLRASDFQGTDFGMSPQPTDLAALGDVQVLRADG
jgi:hypothetical protein